MIQQTGFTISVRQYQIPQHVILIFIIILASHSQSSSQTTATGTQVVLQFKSETRLSMLLII